MSTDETITEQIPLSLREFSSQYGSNSMRSYAVENICSDAEIYPLYGDSTSALVFRTYGPWWIDLPSYQANRQQLARRENGFTSRDFIEIEYKNLVSQCISLNIYETYNPGSLEVVYAGKEEENGRITWHQVWRFPQPFSIVLKNNEEIFITNGRQQMNDLFPDHVNTATSALYSLQLNTDHQLISKIQTSHPYPPAARMARILKIPLENKVAFPTKHIRLEFDHSTANYYIEIDTIKLCGRYSSIPQINQIVEKSEEIIVEEEDTTHITNLPFDLLVLICSYLDLPSLIKLSSTCRHFRQQCLDSLQFRSLDLQPYWNGITNESIEHFFLNYCTQTRYLSLAWTKFIDHSPFEQLLSICSDNLLQLNLACCFYLTGEHIQTIANCCPKIELLSLENCVSLIGEDFLPLTNLHHIRSLNVYRTKIDYRTLLPLIDNNKEHFEHINLGSCQNLVDIAGIVKLLFGRCTNLRSVDLWRARQLTTYDYLSIVGLPMDTVFETERLSNLEEGIQEDLALVYSTVDMPFQIQSLNHLKSLMEIDFGWTNLPGGFIKSLVQQAGHSLIKIFLTACRNVSIEDIFAISENCRQLRQLDILGSNIVTEESIESIFKNCPQIEFIDLSFCSRISPDVISSWIRKYRNCIKQSYQPTSNDDVYFEFP